MSHFGQAEWLAFMQKGHEPVMRKCVLDGWKRSKARGLDAFEAFPPKSISPASAGAEDRPFIEAIRSCVEASMRGHQALNITWLLCGARGEILHVGPTPQVIKDALAPHTLEPGICLDEERAGSNAVSLAIESMKPSFCAGHEHYLKRLHPFACAAAPFYRLDGSPAGFASLVAPSSDYDGVKLLGMVMILVQTIDRDLRLGNFRTVCASLKKIQSRLCSPDAEATIVLSRSGHVRQINPEAAKLLSLTSLSAVEEKPLDALASFSPPIKDVAQSAIACEGKPMEIRLPDKTIEVVYDKIPLFSETEEFVGVVLAMREKGSSKKESSFHKSKFAFKDIIGKTQSIMMAKELAQRAAKTSVNVLLTGASGTGKEMFAHSIHTASDRRRHPFISINCAAIPREIAESELFGYAPGAFTGAVKGGNIGKLESANNGTVFLDEIGDMPLELQSKLLRVLEDKTITRIGDSREVPINIRVIAATNKDISELLEEGKFREDLYYRLSVTAIHLPSLANLREDIPELAQSFVNYFNAVMGKKVKGIAPEIIESMQKYPWPGNIRELRNAIEFAVMVNAGEEWIGWKDIPGKLRNEMLYSGPSETQLHDPLFHERQGIENSERALYLKAIEMAGGNMSKAAKILNVGRATLYRKMKRFGIAE